MDNIGTEGTQDQYITSPSGEALGKDFHMINSECDKKITQQFLNWDARKQTSAFVASLVYIKFYGGHDSNVDMY